jgi:hypothetical protein
VADSPGTTGFNGKPNMLWWSDLSRRNCHAQTEPFRRRAEQLGESIVDGECFVSGDIQTDDLLRASKCLEGVQRVSDVRKVYLCSIDRVHYVILTSRPLEDSTVVGWQEKIFSRPTCGGAPDGHSSRDLL